MTPTPSKTASQYVQTPVGMLSVFGFETPIPYPFGNERTSYLVTDIDQAGQGGACGRRRCPRRFVRRPDRQGRGDPMAVKRFHELAI
ncbi:hypothetical protein OKW30_005127 [Paraburkholderia sp. Clong3]|nr:hypothetical protein [Paraburkholderia sp. CI2]